MEDKLLNHIAHLNGSTHGSRPDQIRLALVLILVDYRVNVKQERLSY